MIWNIKETLSTVFTNYARVKQSRVEGNLSKSFERSSHYKVSLFDVSCGISLKNSLHGIKELNKIRRNFRKNLTSIVHDLKREGSVLSFKVLHKISYLCKYLSSLKGEEIITILPHNSHTKSYYNNCKLRHLKMRRLKLSKSVFVSALHPRN